jgi:hypothetical protein
VFEKGRTNFGYAPRDLLEWSNLKGGNIGGLHGIEMDSRLLDFPYPLMVWMRVNLTTNVAIVQCNVPE